MKSPSTCSTKDGNFSRPFFSRRKKGTGFTLIEILIVIAIILFLASMGLFMSFDTFRGSSLNGERYTVISLLEKARGQSMNNLDQTMHGFCFQDPDYVVFEKDTPTTICSTATKKESFSGNATLSGIPTDGIIFEQLSGSPSWSGDMTLTQDGKTITISVNSEGMIDWSP